MPNVLLIAEDTDKRMKLVMVVKQMWPDGGIQLDKMVKNLFDSPARKGEP